MEHKTRTKALSWVLALAMILTLLPTVTLPAAADGGPTVLESEVGDSDGVVYQLTLVDGNYTFTQGERLIFATRGVSSNYYTALPVSTGFLYVGTKKGGDFPYNEANLSCYVNVERATAGFNNDAYGTLNNHATEYNSYTGSVQHLSGATYTWVEKPFGSKVQVTLTMDGMPWSDARVALYRGETKLRETMSGSNGVYDLGYWQNGTYDIYVDGRKGGEVTVNAKPKSAAVGAPGAENSDGFQYVTDLTFGPTLAYTSNSTYHRTQVTLNADRLMNGANVTLRDNQGRIIRVLACTSTEGTNAVFTGYMEGSDDYDVYVDDQPVYQKVSPGGDATVTFYTVTVTVKKNNSAWTDAILTLDNGRNHYTLTHGSGGEYTADVLAGSDYTLTAEGVIDNGTNTVSAEHKTLTLDYYTVRYYSYDKVGDDSFTPASLPARQQIVRAGSTTSAPSDVYVEGLSFRWYSAEQWANGQEPKTAFDYDTPINDTTTLYAQFGQPRVEINEFLRTDADGTLNGSGTNFRMGNLTISGYDESDSAILSATVSVKNVSSIKVVSTSDYTVKSAGGSAISSNGATTDSGVTVKFGSGVSMAAAQVWLRTNLVFTPASGQTSEVEVSVSDKDLTAAQTTPNTQSRAEGGMTQLTSSMNDLDSGYYYVNGDVTYSGSTGQAGLRIKSGAKVYIYILSGATLTATGGNGSGQTPGGAGILVPAGSTLCLDGQGAVTATGGKAGNGSNGTNGTGFKTNNTFSAGGDGGAGGGGAGAGIGTNGGKGGAGGNGHSGGYNATPNQAGTNGDQGNSAGTPGSICILGSLSQTINGGGAGTAGSPGASGNPQSLKGDGTGYDYKTGGGGGGGGGAGGSGASFGPGGGGGQGGQGGYCGNDRKLLYDDVSATKGANGANGGAGSAITLRSSIDGFPPSYTVTFTNATSHRTQNYSFSGGGRITVPDVGSISGKFFLGWQVTKYGSVFGSNSVPLTSAEQTYYQPGEQINLAANTSGNITLTAIYRDMPGVVSTDKGSMALSAGSTTYYTYTIQTQLDGVNKDMGPLTLESGSATRTLTADATGRYTMTLTSNDEYTVTAEKYPGMVEGKTATPGTTTTIDFETLTVNVEGYSPESVTLKSDESAGPALTGNGAKTSWTALRMQSEVNPNYDVYVDGVEADAFLTVDRNQSWYASWGASNAVTVSYYTVTATVSGNETITSAELRSGTTNVALTKSGGSWTVTRMREATPATYTLYVNGVEIAGQTADFTQNAALSAALYRLTVNTRVDGVAADAGDVTIGGKAATAVATGKYQLVTTSLGELAANVGNVDVGTVSNSTYDLTADFYSVKYKNGVIDAPGKDGGIHRAGDTITVLDKTGAEPTEPFDTRTSEFAGWSDGTTTYQPDAIFTMPASAVRLTSAWTTKEGFSNPTAAAVTGVVKQFNAQPQEVAAVDESGMVGGTMYYALGTDADTPPLASALTTSIPTGTNVGTYYVWYRVMGDNTHRDGTLQYVVSTITRADIDPTVTLANWTYGDNPSEPSIVPDDPNTVTFEGNPGSGEVTYTYKVKDAEDNTYTETVPTLAGDYTVKAVIAETANYNAGTATADFTISRRPITVTAKPQTAQRGDKAVDGNENIKINAEGDDPKVATTDETAIGNAVEWKLTTGTGDALATGDKLTSITLVGDTTNVTTEGTDLVPSDAVIKSGDTDKGANYNITYVKGNLQVIPTRPEIKTGESVTASAITYGQSLENSDITGAVMQDKNTSVAVEGTFAWKNGDIKPTVADSNSTKYTVVFTPTGEFATSYSPTEIKVTVEVGKAPLTVTAEDKEMVYRTTVPALTYTVSGLVNNETASDALTGALTTTGSSTANVGTYDITKGSLGATANYEISSYTKGTLTISKADQTAPAAKEGFTISDGKITVSTNKNTAANSETGYEVYEFSNAEDTTGTVKSSPVTIDAAKLYKIRWAGGDNYNPSPWTDIATTAKVTVTIMPNSAAGSVALTNGGKYPISSSVTLNAAANANYQFASWQDSSGKTLSYEAAYAFTLEGDTALKAVFVDQDKTVVQLPEVSTTDFTYDGTEKTGVTAGAGCTLTNDKATNAGSYTATVELTDKTTCVWADGTTDDKDFPWSIAKADQDLPDVTLTGTTFTATPASGTVPQDPALVVYYSQDASEPRTWTPVPDGGITDAVGVYYFYTQGNDNYNDSAVATKSGGKPTVVSTLQPTDLTTDSATLNASVSDPDGNIAASGVRVKLQWKLASAGSWTDIDAPTYTYGTTVPFTVTHSLTGLAANTDYAYRAVATLKNGSEVVGNTISFRTPKVTPPSGSISVTVNSTTARDVVVSVEEGNNVISSAERTTNGSVTFSNLPDGFYNVVVRTKDGSYVETRMIAIQDGAGTATAFTIPDGKLATVVDIKTPDTPPVAVEGLNAMISDAEKTAAASGDKNVEVELDVEKKAQSAIPAAELSALNAVVVSGGKIDTFLDMSLYKTTTTLTSGVITDSTTVNIGGSNTTVLEIAIPYADARTKEIMVYRYHGGVASALTKVDSRIGTPTAGGDGKFYVDADNGYIFLYASGFSTYAIGTPKPAPAPAPAPTGGGGGWFPTPTPTPTPTPAKDITDPTVTGVADWLITDDHIVYLNGYPDGTIAPNDNITRAEVAMIFYRLLLKPQVEVSKTFPDVEQHEWYATAVNTLASLNIVNGFPDGSFGPTQQITRAEFTAIATRFAKATGGTADFSDVPRDFWAYGNIATASTYGWINGYGDGRFGPQGKITRAETATIVNHMLARAADQEWVLANPDKIRYFADLQDPKKWYYYDMVEASNEHDFTKDDGVEKWKK